MKTEKGTLKQVKKSFQVNLPTKKGSANLPIPEAARCFRHEDAEEGVEVLVERDDKNRIVRVTIPGKPEVSPAGPVAAGGQGRGRNSRHQGRRGGGRGGPPYSGGHGQPKAVSKTVKSSADVLGLPFHNPYTFLPFSSSAPKRRSPTPLSIDESPQEKGRLTGILELEVRSETPVLTCHSKPEREENNHKTYPALTIGPDVIVPASGVRGAVRTLLTILTGGTLGYMNQHTYLCQGRDLNLGPRGPSSAAGTPENVFLGEVIEPGTAFRPGRIRIGRASLIKAEDLRSLLSSNPALRSRCGAYADKHDPLPRNVLPEKKHKSIKHLWLDLDNHGEAVAISDDAEFLPRAAKIKLSGRPVGNREQLGNKQEGILPLGETEELVLPSELWSEYSSRHAFGDRPELYAGDLVWIEPSDPDAKDIQAAEQVASLQWARLGKRGTPLREKIPAWVWPDCAQYDGLVDEVTDLFGQVPLDRKTRAPSFAARVRPENLVFFDAAAKVERVTLAPLAPPHPGCIAFYRDNGDPDKISENDDLRGYKIYRTTRETGPDAPWRYETQGVYDGQGLLKQGPQKVCKTCDLLPNGVSGQLRIAFRALTPRELALLVQVCSVPWRLGGGKPLGLGLCAVHMTDLIDENGETLQVSGWTIVKERDGALHLDGWQQEVADLQTRVQMWIASQRPVEKLRYPRAVRENDGKNSRGGHAWFERHASPPMPPQKEGQGREPGLKPLHIDGKLRNAAQAAGQPLDPTNPLIAGQVLPCFDSQNPDADVLYGYDGYNVESEVRQRPRRQVYLNIESFDETKHVTGREQSEGSHGKDAQFRKDQKRRRRKQ